jgi:hypothetical protein
MHFSESGGLVTTAAAYAEPFQMTWGRVGDRNSAAPVQMSLILYSPYPTTIEGERYFLSS